MPCVKQTTGRYIAEKRKSPPYPAQACKNQAKVGRDGTMWISLPDKNLKYTWKSYGGTAHKKAIKEDDPLKGILKAPRTKAKTTKTVRFKNGNGSRSRKKAKTAKPKKGTCKGLECLTVVELKQKAKGRGMKGYSTKNKAALVALLSNGNGKKKTAKKQTPAQARKSPGYTKKKGKVGQTLYYKNGKRIAKKNVPVKYQ